MADTLRIPLSRQSQQSTTTWTDVSHPLYPHSLSHRARMTTPCHIDMITYLFSLLSFVVLFYFVRHLRGYLSEAHYHLTIAHVFPPLGYGKTAILLLLLCSQVSSAFAWRWREVDWEGGIGTNSYEH